MHKLLCFFILCMAGFQSAFGVVRITGNAPSYAGQSLVAFSIDDYLSGKRSLMKKVEVQSSGTFELVLDIAETQSVVLSINRVEGTIYVQPNHTYSVVFPSDLTSELKRFDRTQVNLELVNLPEDDLNLLIEKFDNDYYSFISDHYYDFATEEYSRSDVYLDKIGAKVKSSDLYKGTESNVGNKTVVTYQFSSIVEEFKSSMNEKYKPFMDNAFFEEYLTYSLAQLDLISGWKRILFYQTYFMSRSILLKNPAYMSCFDVFYSNFLSNRSSELQSRVTKCINVERDPQKLISLFESDSTALSSQIRTLAVVKGLSELYNNKSYNRISIEKMLANIHAENSSLNLIAANLLETMRKGKEGWPMEDFTLVDENSEKWTLSEHREVPVYILFFASWNASSLKEMQIMQKWKEKYGKDVLFVAICMDEKYDQFKKYLNEHKDQKFVFLFGNGDPLITEKCAVRSIPHAVMVDEEGKCMSSFVRLPGAGIQMDFDKIFLMHQTAKQSPATWNKK